MAAQSPDDRKQGILEDLGQGGDTPLADQIDTLWDRHANKPTLDLQTEYTRLAAINFLAGRKTEYHDYTLGGGTVSESKGQVPRNFDLLRQDCRTEIKRLWAQIRANRPAQVGQLVTRTVEDYTTSPADPNDPFYRGHPKRRRPGSLFWPWQG